MARKRDPERQKGQRVNGKVSTSYRLDPEVLGLIDAAAEAKERPRSWVVEQAVREYARRERVTRPPVSVAG